MRKLYLEPEKPPEIIQIEYTKEKRWWEIFLEILGFKLAPRTAIREESRRIPRRWRWQTHTEVEEESGIIRHEEFFQ